MASPTTELVRSEARLFAREPLSVFWVMAFPTLLLLGLGLVPSFREADPDLGGRTVVQLYVPTAVLLSMIVVGAQAMPEVLVGYRQRKILRRLQTTPIGPARLLGANAVVGACAVLVATVLCLCIGRVVHDAPLPQEVPGYVIAYALALVAMMATGAALTAVSPTAAVVNVLGMATMFASMFTAGVWLPVEAMPDGLRNVVELTPMGASTQALNDAAHGEFPAWAHLATTSVWAAVLAVVAVRRFRWE